MGKPVLAPLVRDRRHGLALVLTGIVLLGAHALHVSLYECPFRSVTGLPCPGCGLTRSVEALLEGDAARSFARHPFGMLFFLGWLMLAVSLFLPEPKRLRLADRLDRFERRAPVPLAILLVFAVWGAARLGAAVLT